MGTFILTVLGIVVALPVVTSMCYAYGGINKWEGFKIGLYLSGYTVSCAYIGFLVLDVLAGGH